MSATRERVLAAIRQGVRRHENAVSRGETPLVPPEHPPAVPPPARAQCQGGAAVDLFERMARLAKAEVTRHDALDEAPAQVARVLRKLAAPGPLLLPADTALRGLDWDRAGVAVAHEDKPRANVSASVGSAFAGVAETGTLVLLSGPALPSGHVFLPDHHFVVLEARRIVGSYEQTWALLRRERAAMPRSLYWVTGPSRSGDIEQTIQLGAHGPVGLHIMLIGPFPP